jgi:hypothetical protein
MTQSSSDERTNRLRNLTETLDDDDNRRDKANMMNILSQEFTRHMDEGEKCTRSKDLGGAEAHRLIAESIHGTLTTFEAIKEWFVPNNKFLNNRWGQRSSRMANSSDRETMLNSLRLKLGRELTEDLRKEGSGIREWFLRDFEREMILTEAFAGRQEPGETVYHRAMAQMIHRTLTDLESTNRQD